MPSKVSAWKDLLSCSKCRRDFAIPYYLPISLGCGHTMCHVCVPILHDRKCPYDQQQITTKLANLPINTALMQLIRYRASCNSTANSGQNAEMGAVGGNKNDSLLGQIPPIVSSLSPNDLISYELAKKSIENLAIYLKPFVSKTESLLSSPMRRQLISLVNCQLMDEESRVRALKFAYFLSDHMVVELISFYQGTEPQRTRSSRQPSLRPGIDPEETVAKDCQPSAFCIQPLIQPLQQQPQRTHLWASVRARGCQFLGPSMQKKVLILILQALNDYSIMSRKSLVTFVICNMEESVIEATCTNIGHVVQLLYRANIFNLNRKAGESSLMELKNEFRNYYDLRREHDFQIIQIAAEDGLQFPSYEWSLMLHGDRKHNDYMQTLIDQLEEPTSLAESIQKLLIVLRRSGNESNLEVLQPHLTDLDCVVHSLQKERPSWDDIAKGLDVVHKFIDVSLDCMKHITIRESPNSTGQCNSNTKHKKMLCRDMCSKRSCPRGINCTYAHSEEELERHRPISSKNSNTSVAGHDHGLQKPQQTVHNSSGQANSQCYVVSKEDRDFIKQPDSQLIENDDHILSLHHMLFSPIDGRSIVMSSNVTVAHQTIALPANIIQCPSDPISFEQFKYLESPPQYAPLFQFPLPARRRKQSTSDDDELIF